MRLASFSLLLLLSGCASAPSPEHKIAMNDSVSISKGNTAAFDKGDLETIIGLFYEACADSTLRLDTLVSDSISYNGDILQKTSFISLIRDSIRREAFVEEYPREEFPNKDNVKVEWNGNICLVNYDVRFGGKYTNASMDFYYHAQTGLNKEGKIVSHVNFPSVDTTVIGRYKAICHYRNEWLENADGTIEDGKDAPMMYNDHIIYLFRNPPLDLLNMREDWICSVALDSITKNGTIVNCYNSVSTMGNVMNTCILVSYRGKKYWTVSESNWLRHEGWDVDTTTDPVTIIHPAYTSANPETFFTREK